MAAIVSISVPRSQHEAQLGISERDLWVAFLSSGVTSVCLDGLRCHLSSFHPIHVSAFGWVLSYLSPLSLSVASQKQGGYSFQCLLTPQKASTWMELIQARGGTIAGRIAVLPAHPHLWVAVASPSPQRARLHLLQAERRGPGCALLRMLGIWAPTSGSCAGPGL